MFSLRLQSSKCFVPCFLGCVQSSILIEYWQGTHLCCFGYAVLWPSGSPLTVLGSELAENHCLRVIILWPSFHRGISSWDLAPGAASLGAWFSPMPWLSPFLMVPQVSRTSISNSRIQTWKEVSSLHSCHVSESFLQRSLRDECWTIKEMVLQRWKHQLHWEKWVFWWFTVSVKSRRWGCVPQPKSKGVSQTR